MTRMVRTTLALPEDIVAAVDRAVQAGKAKNRAAWIAEALRRELAALERAAIDQAFADMAKDADYLREVEALDAEFAGPGWEALRRGEGRS
ncbi:MAG TPA: ribbon-helix-helix domain-containing protein [Bacillota bacterium]|nr:ribbon-helix-helix domain-containing protein [Bacillota bacterium]